MTKKEQSEAIKSLIESGEIDLGFCTIKKIRVGGGRGKSHNTDFTIKPFFKLGVIMGEELKGLLRK